ncbi:MAG: hypothetical protein KatS3mg027_2475 [Bacteroidia bacterium]|nr:MAG: hypothetical protein KatS3mg027_2475 [Bacteroidia bacterium]
MKKIILVLLMIVFGVTILVITLLILFSKGNCRYELGDGYALDICENKSNMQLLDSENAVIVPPVILEYAYDSTFIILSQRPWKVPGVSYRLGMTLDERDSIFKHSTFRQYFIINKKEKHEFLGVDSSLMDIEFYGPDSLIILYPGCENRYSNVYGPFNKEEYLQKREELGVPKELQLKE